jgi:uncharacterized protein YacL
MPKFFLRWWLLIVLTGVGVVIANYFNMIEFVWNNDFTKLSFVIAAIFTLTSVVIGYKMFESSRSTTYISYEKEWLASEHLLSLGLLGTVIGMLYTFLGAFEDLDISNTDAAQQVISAMASGLGAAFCTTAAGLVFSMLLKTQLVMAEEAAE